MGCHYFIRYYLIVARWVSVLISCRLVVLVQVFPAVDLRRLCSVVSRDSASCVVTTRTNLALSLTGRISSDVTERAAAGVQQPRTAAALPPELRRLTAQRQPDGRLPTRSRPECVPGQYTVSFSQLDGYPLAHAQNVYQVSTRSVSVKWPATHSLTPRMCTRSVHGQFQLNGRLPTRSRPECVPGQYTVSFSQLDGYPLAHAQNVYQVSTPSVSVNWTATHSLTP